ncbi:PD-(D/E)XK nuclease domain-containing protein [Streptomyces hygroscopicus]|uniref:PD-(D/E)XK nuclease domain-containing protein n=1 Tax=Streptomyces hygroscopicus TaxID=1912 RepID=UPI0037B27428
MRREERAPSVSREEWTPKNAGSAKRIDLIVKDVGIVIECKYVRDARHAKRVADELRVDFESYHVHSECRRLFAYVHDPGRHILDPEEFMRALSGLRKKGDSEFTVTVIVG